MLKKIFIPAGLILFALSLHTLYSFKTKTFQEKPEMPPLSLLKSEPITISKTPELSAENELEKEIIQIKKELAAIDVATEVNNPATAQARREWIIGRMNLYAKKMGQLAKLQVEQVNAEIKKELQQ